MQCNFCLEECESLIESHIIPKFVYKWIKDTSTTGRLRDSRNINRPVQDGFKVKYLCSKCEVDFSIFEKYFSEEVFTPFANSDGDISKINIDPDKFKKFVSSLLWRATKYFINNRTFNGDFSEYEIKYFNECANELKESFKKDGVTPFTTYLIPLTSELVNNKTLKVEDYAYFERSTSIDIRIYDKQDSRSTLFVKLPFMLIVCELKSYAQDIWNGININDILLDSLNYQVPEYVNQYMIFDCTRHYDSASEISSSQQEKIKNIVMQKANKNQGTVKAIIKNLNR
jgi:hypothetical protein